MKLILAFFIFPWSSGLNADDFIHPGGMFNQADMDRMRYQVEARIDPWFTSFQELQSEPLASFNYSVRGDPGWTTVSRDPPIRRTEFESDVTAAYLNAIMWIVTRDERHAEKCVEIFNTWKNLTEVRGGGTESLNAGLFAWKLVEAAEIIRSTYNGWDPQDLQDFQDMLVYPGYSNTTVPPSLSNTNGTFYWRIYRGDPGRHGNQDMIAWRAMITMGVFLDNRVMYDRALRYFSGHPSREDDLPYPSGPSPSGNVITDNEYFTAFQYRGSSDRIPDYGYNGVLEHFIWANGQTQESSRDQQHALFGLGTAAGIAEVAWTQGDDVWNSLDNRLLAGFEFNARYNASYIASFPDQSEPWEPDNFIQRADRTGRWFSKKINPHFESNFVSISRGGFPGSRPIFEQALAHFDVRMGQGDLAVWTQRARDVAVAESGYERTGWSLDHPGWGALTFRRPPLTAGDPVQGFSNGRPIFGVHRIPATIPATDFDYFPVSGQGRTYFDQTSENNGGEYRPDDAVDIASHPVEGYFVTDMEAGEWLTYTVSIPEDGWYRIDLRYAASAEQGALRFEFGGNDATGNVVLLKTGGLTGWEDRTVSESIYLRAGVQAMRVFVAGESNVISLSEMTVSEGTLPSEPPEAPASLSTTAVSSGEVRLEWPAVPATVNYNVKRSTVAGGPYEVVAAAVPETEYSDTGLTGDTMYYYVVSAVNDAGEGGDSPEAWVTTPGFSDGVWNVNADGSWPDSGNWLDGAIADGSGAAADFSQVTVSSNRTVTLDGDRTIGHAVFGKVDDSHDWAIDSGTGGVLVLSDADGTPSITVNASATRIFVPIAGEEGFAKAGDGLLVLENPGNGFSGDLVIADGVVRAPSSGSLGAGTEINENRIIVEEGGTFHLGANVQRTDKQARLAGAGAGDGEGGMLGAFYVDASGTGNGTRWSHNGGTNPAIALDADATIRIDGDGFGQNSSNILLGHIDLGGHTLTKMGTGRITLDLNNSATGNGTFHVAEGVLGLTHNSIRNGVELIIGEAGEVRGGRTPAPLNSTTNMVTVDGRLVLSERTDNTNTNQHIGVLQGSGVITTGIWGNTGQHTLNIRHPSADSYFSGLIEEESGIIHLVKGQAGDSEATGTLTLDGEVRQRGDTTVHAGALLLGPDGRYTFHIRANGSSNRVLGQGTAHFEGRFRFELGDAGDSMGATWQVVDAGNLAISYGAGFNVEEFVQVDNGLWRANAGGFGYAFIEDSATLERHSEFSEEELLPMQTGFELWRKIHFGDDAGNPEIAGPDADPDGDGLPNLLEFGLGGYPLANSLELVPVVETSGGVLTLTFRRVREAESDLVYRVEAAESPEGDWSEIWNSQDHPYDSDEEIAHQTVSDTEPMGESPGRFLRLTVTKR